MKRSWWLSLMLAASFALPQSLFAQGPPPGGAPSFPDSDSTATPTRPDTTRDTIGTSPHDTTGTPRRPLRPKRRRRRPNKPPARPAKPDTTMSHGATSSYNVG